MLVMLNCLFVCLYRERDTPDGELKTPGVTMEEARVSKSLGQLLPFLFATRERS